MSLLAALAKGFGAGTLENAKVGFAEQQRQREAEQRKAEQSAEWQQRNAELDKRLGADREETDKRIAAQKEDTQTRLDAQAKENALSRQQEWALFERKLAEATRDAAASASAKTREANAKNLIGTFDSLSKRKNDIMANDKITEEQRDVALGEIDNLGYTIASDKGAQALLSEFGGAGYAQYWLSMAPPQKQEQAPPSNQPPAAQTAPAIAPPKPTGIIPRLQGDRAVERQILQSAKETLQSGKEALAGNPNADAAAAKAYQRIYQQ